ncbi:YoaK family protein [Arthrobacter sp. MMS18-M83]|uniref:YoaK family protein n=1 Tax=Arthrobacter sp. MMS18-M83 TaxID=2996261 RepID=UPI00227D09E8|nr:YoaK family protein [Arthrobacter sp. MMS18-M83]WAH97496.1 YoaK family protein [Arthrobacter sp. MMS18-M83]
MTRCEADTHDSQLSEAGRLIVPRRGDRHGPLSPLLLVLTIVTGLVDAFSYLCLGRVLVANMTGNIVFGGFALGGAPGFTWWALLLSAGAVMIGAWIGGNLIARHSHRGRLLSVASAIESAVLAGAWLASLIAPQPYVGVHLAVLIAILGVALGLQNATARSLQVPDLATSVLTLTIIGIAADTAARVGSRWGRRSVPVLTMFLGGAAGAALVVSGLGPLDLALSACLAAAVAAAAATTFRSTGAWTEWEPPAPPAALHLRYRGRLH